MNESNKTKHMRLKEEEKEMLRLTRWQYPDLWKENERDVKRFSKAIWNYPDLDVLPFKLIILGAAFRDELMREFSGEWTSEMSSARGHRFQNFFTKQKEIPKDLPALDFTNECVICEEHKKGITLCPDCWERIRKALEIKTTQSRQGWDGYGYECNCLDLDNVAKLLGLKKKSVEVQVKLEQKKVNENNQ